MVVWLTKALLVLIFISTTLIQKYHTQDEQRRTCEWDASTYKCIANSKTMLESLSLSNNPLGYMMRCQYANDQTTCTNMSEPTSCVWDQDACHISTSYLLDVLRGCTKISLWDIYYYDDNLRCLNKLEEIRSKHTWIERNIIKSISDCQEQFSGSKGVFSLDDMYGYCKFIQEVQTCSFSSRYCDDLTQSQHPIGKQMLSDIRYLLYGHETDSDYLWLNEIGRIINIDYLSQLRNCDDNTNQSSCESKYLKDQLPRIIESDDLCTLDASTNTCTQDPDAMISILSDSQKDIGYMIRCQYALNNATCMEMDPPICVWESDSCHISTDYLHEYAVNYTVSSCRYATWSMRQLYCGLCFEQLGVSELIEDYWEDTGSGTCRGILPTSSNPRTQFGYIGSLLDCGQDTQNSICFDAPFNYHTVGQEFQIQVQNVFGDGQQSPLILSTLENILNIKRGTIQKFADCSSYTASSQCKVQQLPPIPVLEPRISSDDICTPNAARSVCVQNEEAMLQLLSKTNSAMGYMMRCQYAQDNVTCMNMQPDTCVWDQESCHISADYLVDSLLDCTDRWIINQDSYQQCREKLQELSEMYTWVDKKQVQSIPECKNAKQYFFSKDRRNCTFLGSLYQCDASRYSNSDYCKDTTYIYNKESDTYTYVANNHTIGQEFLSDVRYVLYGEESSGLPLSLYNLEFLLNIEQDNLDRYMVCDWYKPEQGCKPYESDGDDGGISVGLIVGLVVGGVVVLVLLFIGVKCYYKRHQQSQSSNHSSVQKEKNVEIPLVALRN